MKKVLLLSSVVAIVALSSCKKDYTCTCTDNGVTVTATIHATKSQAKSACDAYVNTYGTGYSCSIN